MTCLDVRSNVNCGMFDNVIFLFHRYEFGNERVPPASALEWHCLAYVITYNLMFI